MLAMSDLYKYVYSRGGAGHNEKVVVKVDKLQGVDPRWLRVAVLALPHARIYSQDLSKTTNMGMWALIHMILFPWKAHEEPSRFIFRSERGYSTDSGVFLFLGPKYLLLAYSIPRLSTLGFTG